jgi:hypothetical protein
MRLKPDKPGLEEAKMALLHQPEALLLPREK